MPDVTNNILITFEGDTSGLTPAQQEVNDSFNKMNDAIGKTQKGLDGADDKLKKYVQDLLNLQKNTTAAFTLKGLTDFEKQISKTTSSTKVLASTIALAKKNVDQFKPDTKEWEEFNKLIKAGEELLKMMGGEEEEVTEKTKSLRTQLREMKAELATIDDPSDPRFLKLATEAAELEDRLGDVSEQVRLLASDTQHLDVAIQAISGLAGAFSVAQGAAALLGAEGEDLQRALLKVNAAMSILQGLQQIQAITDKNSALNIALIKALRLQDTAAIGAQTVATEGATVATKGLNAAMAANPAALLILTLTTLVGLMIAFSKSTESAADAQEKLNAQLEYNKQFSDDTIKFLTQAGKERIAQMKAQGATEQQIRDEERRQLQEQLEIRREDLQKTVDAGENAAGKLQQLVKNNFEIEKHYTEVGQDGVARDRIKRIKVEEDYLDALKKTQEDGLNAQREIDEISSELRIKDFENQAEVNKEFLDKQKEFNEEQKRIAEANAQAILNIRQRALQATADFYKQIADDPSFGRQIQLDALQKSLDAQKEILRLQKEFELSKEKLTALQKKDIIDKYNTDVAKLTQEGYERRNQIIATANATQLQQQQDYYNQLIAEHQKYLDKINSNVDEQFRKYSATNDNEQVARLKGVEDEYKAGLISLEQFLQKRATINNSYQNIELNNDIALLEAKISNMRALGEDTTDLQEQLNQKLKQKYDKNAQDFTDAEAKKQQAMEKTQQILDASFQIAGQLFSNYLQSQQNDLQEQEQQVQDLADKKAITEEEAAKRIAGIRRQQAVLNKASALFEIAINTAVAASKAAAQTGVGATVSMPLVIGLGLAQAAIVAAEPLPKYKKGKVKIDGPGTDTSDSILAMLSRHESVINAEATRRYEPALKAMNDLKFEEYLLKNIPHFEMPVMTEIPQWAMQQSMSSNIDYDKLGESFAKHVGKISEMPQAGLSFDEHGVRMWMRKQDQLDIYLNKRFGYTRS